MRSRSLFSKKKPCRILFANPLHPFAERILKTSSGLEMRHAQIGSPAFQQHLKRADILVARTSTKVDEKVLNEAKSLKLVAVPGTGVDHVDLIAAQKLGIQVMHSPDGNAVSTAELSLALILNSLRGLPEAHRALKAKKWDREKFLGRKLEGRKVGIVGLGRVGGALALRLRALGAQVFAYDPGITLERFRKFRAKKIKKLSQLISKVEIISLHCPLNRETQKMINSYTLSFIKKPLVLINAARGGLVDEATLLKALQKSKVLTYTADVFAEEPLPKNHPFRKHPRVILSPHLGSQTLEAQFEVSVALAEQILLFKDSGLILNQVRVEEFQ